MITLQLEQISKRFGPHVALQPLDLTVPAGQLVALLGPSGCGKTTLLRMLAGLEAPDQGKIWFDQQPAHTLSVQARRVGFVFQHYALFPHLSVFDNVAFGLNVQRQQRWSKQDIKQRVMELLERVQLAHLAQRKPDQLSGGQRQRVALARALAIDPQILLLDEPFGALDAQVRQHLRQWLRTLHRELKLTTVIVTHDQEEALELADHIVVLNQGRIEQQAALAALYQQPATPFVMQFIGAAQALTTAQVHQLRSDAAATQGFLRPTEAQLLLQPGLQARALPLRVKQLDWSPQGTLVQLVDSHGDILNACVPAQQAANWTHDQTLWLESGCIHWFDAQDRRLAITTQWATAA